MFIFSLFLSFIVGLVFAKLTIFLLGKRILKPNKQYYDLTQNQSLQEKTENVSQVNQSIRKQTKARKNQVNKFEQKKEAQKIIQQFRNICAELLKRFNVMQKVRQRLSKRSKQQIENLHNMQLYHNQIGDDISEQSPRLMKFKNCSQDSKYNNLVTNCNTEFDRKQYRDIQVQLSAFVVLQQQYIEKRYILVDYQEVTKSIKQLYNLDTQRDRIEYRKLVMKFISISHLIQTSIQWEKIRLLSSDLGTNIGNLIHLCKRLQKLNSKIQGYYISQQNNRENLYKQLTQQISILGELYKQKQMQIIVFSQNNNSKIDQRHVLQVQSVNQQNGYNNGKMMDQEQIKGFGRQLTVFQIDGGEKEGDRDEQQLEGMPYIKTAIRSSIVSQPSRKLFMKQLEMLLAIGQAKKQQQRSDQQETARYRQDILLQSVHKSQIN